MTWASRVLTLRKTPTGLWSEVDRHARGFTPIFPRPRPRPIGRGRVPPVAVASPVSTPPAVLDLDDNDDALVASSSPVSFSLRFTSTSDPSDGELTDLDVGHAYESEATTAADPDEEECSPAFIAIVTAYAAERTAGAQRPRMTGKAARALRANSPVWGPEF